MVVEEQEQAAAEEEDESMVAAFHQNTTSRPSSGSASSSSWEEVSPKFCRCICKPTFEKGKFDGIQVKILLPPSKEKLIKPAPLPHPPPAAAAEEGNGGEEAMMELPPAMATEIVMDSACAGVPLSSSPFLTEAAVLNPPPPLAAGAVPAGWQTTTTAATNAPPVVFEGLKGATATNWSTLLERVSVELQAASEWELFAQRMSHVHWTRSGLLQVNTEAFTSPRVSNIGAALSLAQQSGTEHANKLLTAARTHARLVTHNAQKLLAAAQASVSPKGLQDYVDTLINLKRFRGGSGGGRWPPGAFDTAIQGCELLWHYCS